MYIFTNKWFIIGAIAVVIAVAAVLAVTIGKHHENISGEKLNAYRFSKGGGMSGGYHSEDIVRKDGYALIRIESAEWHNSAPEVKEYKADVKIMDELEGIIRKYNMNFWDGKKFTDIFVCDGESSSYSFVFDDSYVSFSSQIYPKFYSDKLSEFKGIIQKYIEKAELLPALVPSGRTTEDDYNVPEGEMITYVRKCTSESLEVKIINKKSENVEIPIDYKVVNAETGDVLIEKKEDRIYSVYPKSQDEYTISLEKGFGAGKYNLIWNDMVMPFELK